MNSACTDKFDLVFVNKLRKDLEACRKFVQEYDEDEARMRRLDGSKREGDAVHLLLRKNVETCRRFVNNKSVMKYAQVTAECKETPSPNNTGTPSPNNTGTSFVEVVKNLEIAAEAVKNLEIAEQKVTRAEKRLKMSEQKVTQAEKRLKMAEKEVERISEKKLVYEKKLLEAMKKGRK